MIEQNKLVIDNYDLVTHLISKFYPQYKNDEDVFGCGYLGLVYAANIYNAAYKTPFRSYARRYICAEIDKYIQEEEINNIHISSLIDHDLVCNSYDSKVYQKLVSEILDDLMDDDNLTDREYTVIKLRYWECLSLREAGVRLKLHAERIRQIERKVLRKLRHPSRSNKLRKYMMD